MGWGETNGVGVWGSRGKLGDGAVFDWMDHVGRNLIQGDQHERSSGHFWVRNGEIRRFEHEVIIEENVYVHHAWTPAKCRAPAHVVLDSLHLCEQLEWLEDGVGLHYEIGEFGLMRNADWIR